MSRPGPLVYNAQTVARNPPSPAPGHVSPAARDHVSQVRSALASLDLTAVDRIAARLHAAHQSGRTIYCLGNGGSAATATHFVSDLRRLTLRPDRLRQLRAISLAANTSLLTSAGNDEGYEETFASQLRGILAPGDVVMGFSTSGASPNVLRALEYGRTAGAATLGITGREGNRLRSAVDEVVTVDASSVQVIEDVTAVIAHVLCLLVRERRDAAGD